MAEILTESFCERCGTRYTFEAAIPKKHRIGRLRVLSKGLKNYVLSEDASLDEALAEARSEDERELSGGQLDAFHQTFQFCMSCRQYTCANCWNEDEGRCLSCAPLSLGGNHLRSPLDDLLAGGGIAPFAPPTPVEEIPTTAAALEANGHLTLAEPAANGSAWPTIDLFRAPDEQSATEMPAPAEMLQAVVETPSVEAAPAEAATVEAEPETRASEAGEAGAAEAGEAEPTTDFWTRPFTGFAPQPEATNGHAPALEPESVELPAALAEPAAEAVAELEPAPEAVAELESIAPLESVADPEPVAAPEASVAPEPALEPAPLGEAAVEAVAEPATIDEPIASAAEEAAVAAAEPIVDEVPIEAPAPEPIAAAPAAVETPALAPIVADPEAAARAAELAQRTSRLLGRFRVQPRSAATTAGEQAAAANAAADAAAAREAAAAAAAAAFAPAASAPQVSPEPEPVVAAAIVEAGPEPAEPAPPSAPEPSAKPSWMFVAPAPEPKPVPEPAVQAWPEPVAWGTWKSEAMIAGTLELPASAQPPAEPAVAGEPIEAAAAPESSPALEPVEAAVRVEPELVLAEPRPVPTPIRAEPASPPPAVAPATDRIEMPGWPTTPRRRLSDSAPVPPQPVLPAVPPPTLNPQWPAPLRPDLDVSSTPFWASGEPGRASTALDVWDASAREVTSAPGIAASPVGVQSCVSCGLSLSATARFCRRCGSRQS